MVGVLHGTLHSRLYQVLQEVYADGFRLGNDSVLLVSMSLRLSELDFWTLVLAEPTAQAFLACQLVDSKRRDFFWRVGFGLNLEILFYALFSTCGSCLTLFDTPNPCTFSQ